MTHIQSCHTSQADLSCHTSQADLSCHTCQADLSLRYCSILYVLLHLCCHVASFLLQDARSQDRRREDEEGELKIARTSVWAQIHHDLQRLCQQQHAQEQAASEIKKACHVKHTCHAACVTQIQCCHPPLLAMSDSLLLAFDLSDSLLSCSPVSPSSL